MVVKKDFYITMFSSSVAFSFPRTSRFCYLFAATTWLEGSQGENATMAPFPCKPRMRHTCFLARCLYLPVPRPPPGGSLGTPKNLGKGATFNLGSVRLHVDNWECRAQKWLARCRKFAVPCRFLSACKLGFTGNVKLCKVTLAGNVDR